MYGDGNNVHIVLFYLCLSTADAWMIDDIILLLLLVCLFSTKFALCHSLQHLSVCHTSQYISFFVQSH